MLTPLDRAMARWLFLFGVCFFLLVGTGVTKAADERTMLELTRSLIDEQSIEVSESFVTVETDAGRIVSKYGLGQPVAVIPLELAGRAIAAPADDGSAIRDVIALSFGGLCVAATAAWAYVLARRLGADAAPAVGVAAAGTFGSFVVVYGTEFFADAFIGLLVVIAVERALADRWTTVFAILAFAMATHARAIPIVAVFGLLCLSWKGIRGTVRVAWPLAIAAGEMALYAHARFGSITTTGYEGEEFTTSPFDGTFGLLFEGSKSVFLFMPVAVVGVAVLARRSGVGDRPRLLIGGTAVTVWVMTAAWFGWEGGWSWGPRFFVPIAVLLATPVAVWLSEDRARWGLVAPLAVVGFAISFPALVAPSNMQKDLPGHRVGPSVLEQYERLPDVIRSGFSGECEGQLAELSPNACLPALWQFHVVPTVGWPGDVAVVLVSGALAIGSVISGRRVVQLARGELTATS